MIAEISAALGGAKAAFELAKTLKVEMTETAVREKTEQLMDLIFSLREKLFEIQGRMGELHDANVELEQKLRDIHAWDREVAPYYEFIALADGVFVYAQRQPPDGGTHVKEALHYLCTRCFGERRKGLLQRQGYEIGGMVYKCEVCGNTITDHSDRPPSWGPVSVTRRDPFPGY